MLKIKKDIEIDEYDNLIKQEDIVNTVESQCRYLISLNPNTNSIAELLSIVQDVYKKFNALKLREYFNYIKHRAEYFFKGLGDNPKSVFEDMGMKANFIKVGETNAVELKSKKRLFREEAELSEICSSIEKFSIILEDSIDKIINLIFDKDYLSSNMSIQDMLNLYDTEEILK